MLLGAWRLHEQRPIINYRPVSKTRTSSPHTWGISNSFRWPFSNLLSDCLPRGEKMATLELTTMIGCPVMCTFCPQENLRTAYSGEKYMSIETAKTIFKKIPQHVRIDFSGMAEPWANPECTEILGLACQQKNQIAIYTTLYGMKRHDAEKTAEIIKANQHKIERICIHLQDKSGNMLGLRFDENWTYSINKFIELYKWNAESKRRFPFEFMTMDSNGRVHEALANTFPLLGKFTAIDRAGSLSPAQLGGQTVIRVDNFNNRIVCKSTPYYDHNVVLPNGDVVLCCMDYDMKNVIGNLLTQEYYEIFESKPLRYVIKNNMKLTTERTICHQCSNTSMVGKS